MTYEEIKRRINMPKRSHQNESMKLSRFDSFSVCENKKGEAIIVDNDIADSVSKRSWCLDGAGYPIVNVNGNHGRVWALCKRRTDVAVRTAHNSMDAVSKAV